MNSWKSYVKMCSPTTAATINTHAPNSTARRLPILVTAIVCTFSVSVDAPAPVPHNPAKKLVRPSSPIPRLTTPGGGALDATSKDVAWYVPTCNTSLSNHHNEYDIMVLWFFQPPWNFPLHTPFCRVNGSPTSQMFLILFIWSPTYWGWAEALLTESTDATIDAMIMTIAVCQWKVGWPHWNGCGNQNHAAEDRASDVSVRQLLMVATCFVQAGGITAVIFLTRLTLQPLYV